MSLVNETMLGLGKAPSVIRETFEYGRARAAAIGRENVYDYSLGNPSIPAPAEVTDTLLCLLEKESPVALHGYTSAPGDPAARTAVAEDLNRRFDAGLAPENIYMTCGAAASLTCTLNALVRPGDEVIVLAPYFPEYRVFVEKAGATLVTVMTTPGSFQPDAGALEAALTGRTKAVIINSPNNPTGAVYTEASLRAMADCLRRFSEKRGEPVFLISDEPYRELFYGEEKPAWVPHLYDAAVVCYSFSKSMSLPGERIGYVAVSPKVPQAKDVFAAVCGAGRALGFVCAPSLMQKMVAKCPSAVSDVAAYRRNRDLLFSALSEDGFSCVPPDGAFYLFVRSPEADAAAFAAKAREFELLLVPSDSFGCPGYVRLSYCVDEEMIRRSLPAFRRLAEVYGLR